MLSAGVVSFGHMNHSSIALEHCLPHNFDIINLIKKIIVKYFS